MQQFLTLALGIILIVFRDPFARFIVLAQNTIWGLKLGEKEIRGSQIVLIVGGLFLIGTTLFAMLGPKH